MTQPIPMPATRSTRRSVPASVAACVGVAVIALTHAALAESDSAAASVEPGSELPAVAIGPEPGSTASELPADDELQAQLLDRSAALSAVADAGASDDGEQTDAWEEEDWDDWDDEFETVPAGFPDPFEPVNRVVLSFNNAVDEIVLDPVTRLYRFLLPDFARQTILRIFGNANSPQVMVNDALQLEWRDAGVITSRLLVNSTVGLGGIFDLAQPLGLEPHESGFGQTLALAGVPSGTYLMLPLLGPANMRDAVGIGVDSLMHPTFYVLAGTDLLIFGGSAGLTTRASHYEELQALKDSSVDVYSALRSGFYQNRQAEIWGRREDRRPESEPVLEPGEEL